MAIAAIKKRLIGFAKWAVLIVVSLLVFLAFASFAWFSTETGRVWSTEKALSVLSRDDGLRFEHHNIRSDSLGHFTVENLKIYQQTSPLVFIHKLELKWRPLALLSKNISVTAITANSVEVFKPETSEAPKKQEPSKTFKFPDGFALPDITVKKAEVGLLSLNGFTDDPRLQPLTRAEIKLRARTTADNFLELTLRLRSENEKPLAITLKGEQKEKQGYALTLNVDEEDGGIIAKILQLPEDENFQARLALIAFYEQNESVIQLQRFSLPLSSRRFNAEGTLSINDTLDPLNIRSDLELSVDDTYHSIRGTFIDSRLDYVLKLNNFPLDIASPWLEDLDNGTLSADLKINGPISSVQATGQASANSVYNAAQINLDIAGDFNQNLLILSKARISVNESRVNAQGRISLDKKTLKVNAQGEDLRIENVRLLEVEKYGLKLPEGLELTVSTLNADLAGPWQRPLGPLSYEAAGEYKNIPFSTSGDVKNTNEALQITTVNLSTSGGESTVSGSLNLDTLLADLNIDANDVPLNLLGAVGLTLPERFSAKASANALVKGKLTAPEVNGQLTLQGEYDALPFDLRAEGKYLDHLVNIEQLVLRSNDDVLLKAGGTYRKSEFDFSLRIDELPTQFFQAFGWAPYAGRINANVRLLGDVESPRLEGSASYATQTTIIDEENHNQVVPLAIELDITSNEEDISIVSTFLREKESTGALNVLIPTSVVDSLSSRMANGVNQLNIAASINGEVDLKAVSYLALSDLNRMDGKITTKITLDGKVSEPTIDGQIGIAKGYYENVVSGTVVSDLDCAIAVDNSAFTINSCSGRDGHSGTLNLSGDFELPLSKEDWEDSTRTTIDLGLKLSNFSPIDQPDLEAEISGDITAKGNFDKLYVSGAVDVSPLNIDISSNSSSDIPQIKVKEVYDIAELEDEDYVALPSRPEIFLDVTINTENQAYLRGRGLDVELGGKIKIGGTAKDLKYNGKFETLRGSAEIFGKLFEIKRGEVRFVDSQFSLLLNAEYEKFGQRIEAEITGSNDDLNLELSSTPSMAEDEILAFILFGKSVANMSPFEAVQLAGAVQKLRGGKSLFDPIGSAREILDVDTLSVSTEETDDGESGVNIGIGKYLNERVYLEFERTPNPSQPWRGRLEIQLLPNLVLESSTGGKTGIEGAQLKWKRDY